MSRVQGTGLVQAVLLSLPNSLLSLQPTLDYPTMAVSHTGISLNVQAWDGPAIQALARE
jgi:hypothetical protein